MTAVPLFQRVPGGFSHEVYERGRHQVDGRGQGAVQHRGRRSDAGAGGQVTVTDSHQPTLRTAPALSSVRQWPREKLTRSGPILSRRFAGIRIITLCLGVVE